MSTNTLKNRVLSVLLVLVMVVSMLPIQVLGADGGAATVITSGGEVAFNVYKDALHTPISTTAAPSSCNRTSMR